MLKVRHALALTIINCCVWCSLSFASDQNADKKSTPEVPPVWAMLRHSALQARQAGEYFKARKIYQDILYKYGQSEGIESVLREYWSLNVAIISSPLQAHGTEIYTIKNGDTLGKIARKNQTTVELIKRRNQLKDNRIVAGRKLSIWRTPFAIVIDKSDNTLTLRARNEIVKVYPVSTGKNNSSPVGEFVIKDRYADPVWFHKGDIVQPDDPKNFLGTRWLGFDLPKYGIHGTIEPQNIGKQVSSGCIRMRNEDVQELYDMVPIGTKVTIQD